MLLEGRALVEEPSLTWRSGNPGASIARPTAGAPTGEARAEWAARLFRDFHRDGIARRERLFQGVIQLLVEALFGVLGQPLVLRARGLPDAGSLGVGLFPLVH